MIESPNTISSSKRQHLEEALAVVDRNSSIADSTPTLTQDVRMRAEDVTYILANNEKRQEAISILLKQETISEHPHYEKELKYTMLRLKHI
jgi:hypothetical protein